MAKPVSSRMPHSRAMCCAVWMLSPVTMRTMMPARLHVATAPGTSLRTGSLMPTMQHTVRSRSGGVSKKSAGRVGSTLGKSV